ncbi:MAG: hypothetical protein K0S44_2038 [Bacteroidetes bacterium]|jgi:hypothetical protein|nr:hypothetical protein [Bacteroidota bacterium]
MKTNVKKLALVLFTLGTVALGCKKEDEVQPASPAAIAQDGTNDQVSKKGYTVTSLYIKKVGTTEEGTNEADKFKGWSFLFHDKGELLAITAEGEQILGKWSSKEGERETITIDFGTITPFNLLNNTWVVTKKTDLSKTMEDRDESDGTTASVVFEK